MKATAHLVLAALLLTSRAAAPIAGQNDQATALDAQIGRIFQANEYASPRFGPARWLADGALYTTVERGDIVRYDAVTGQRTVFVPSARLVPPGATAALAIDDYVWSKDGRGCSSSPTRRKCGARTPAAITGCSTSCRAD